MEGTKKQNYNKLIDLMLLGTIIIPVFVIKTIAEATEITLNIISIGL